MQAEIARQYGARVYCVGVKDFDKDQVNQALFFIVNLKCAKFDVYVYINFLF